MSQPTNECNFSAMPGDFVPAIAPADSGAFDLPVIRKFYPDVTMVWHTPFALLDMKSTLKLACEIIRTRTPEYFVTANLNYLMLVEKHPQLIQVNQNAAAVLADGYPIVLRSRLGEQPLPCRVAGSDLIIELARVCSESGYRIYFLGAAEGVAEEAAAKLVEMFPRLGIAGCYSPPFRPLSPEENRQMIANINRAEPDILLVAFGQPKGELWIHENLGELRVPLSIQLGASFDFLAGTAKRAPWIWQRLGLEWLHRTLDDPKRLGPRYAANIQFLLKQIRRDFWPIRDSQRPIGNQPAAF
jgi:N-acetylglucosaminyldiphosphoundecaprenol N-acetyl-beta-D-mannosaminyltransferase